MEGLCISGALEVWRVRVGPGCADDRLDAPLSAYEIDRLSNAGEAALVGTYRNKVVDLGRSLIRALIGNGLSLPSISNGVQSFPTVTIADLAIFEMRFGNLNSPTAPTAADFQMEDVTLLHTATPVVTYPTNFTVRWSGLIPANTYVGQQVTEEGLFAVNGALFARTTFPAEAIVSGFAVNFAHTFSLTAA